MDKIKIKDYMIITRVSVITRNGFIKYAIDKENILDEFLRQINITKEMDASKINDIKKEAGNVKFDNVDFLANFDFSQKSYTSFELYSYISKFITETNELKKQMIILSAMWDFYISGNHLLYILTDGGDDILLWYVKDDDYLFESNFEGIILGVNSRIHQRNKEFDRILNLKEGKRKENELTNFDGRNGWIDKESGYELWRDGDKLVSIAKGNIPLSLKICEVTDFLRRLRHLFKIY